MVEVPAELVELARSAARISVLTGAGMSAESGVPTFRDAQDGLWARYDPMTLATPEAFEDQPDLVWAWYSWRRQLMTTIEPHAGHRALTRWGERAAVDVITQNVDDLHERAGHHVLAHLHGSLFSLRCFDCDLPYDKPVELPTQQVERLDPPLCPACLGHIRPDIVWFGEPLPVAAFERAEQSVTQADLVLVIGTSGAVFPAAGLPLLARANGVPTVEINPVPTELSHETTLNWRTTAGAGLPALVSALG
ncbi:SIR2 family NAD-dependent protein deacylase [Propionibacteriaceae bacterium Y1685]